MVAYTHVDKPVRIAGTTLRNRIFRSGHGTGFGLGGITDDFIAYHLARAKGGVALSILEILPVHDSSPAFLPTVTAAGMAEGYRRLVAAVAPHGMALYQQIWHGGHNAVRFDGGVTYSASDVPSPFWSGAPPVPMTKVMIDEIVGAFARSAASLEAWGLQGVEIHAAHNYLIQQFLQRSTNKRQDEYGGSLENRARLLIEILTAIRASVSRGFAVGIRIGKSEDGGPSDAEELAAVIRMVEARGLIDFVDASHAGYYALSENIGGMDKVVGHELQHNAPIRAAATVPVLVIGRFRTLEEADQVIRAGDADMVGMTRATIADPDLVAKSLTGDEGRVRPCIGCLQDCLGGLMTSNRLGCVVNPDVGNEARLVSDPAPVAKRVVVVGGGPAGMEAARVAAARGHQTILFEAAPRLGGSVQLAARAPARAGIGDIIGWLEAEIYYLGVDVRLSSYVDADDILAEAPDEVIIATGSWPRLDGVLASHPGGPIDGMDHRTVTSSNDLMAGTLPVPGSRAVVVDDIGHYEPIAVAETLIAQGVSVEFVTRHVAFAPHLENTFQNEAHLRRLTRTGHFTIRTRTRVVGVSDAGVAVVPTYQEPGGNLGEILPADTVVVVTANAANRAVHDELTVLGRSSHLVGDALAPRYLGAAIRDGRTVATAL